MARKKAPVIVRSSPRHGRGVFATRAIEQGELVEECPLLVMSGADLLRLDKTALRGYCFGLDDDGAAFPLGFGALYNHSGTPNVEVYIDEENQLAEYSSVKAVEKGEELTIDYTGSGAVELWFEAADG
jgi:SET domain-containing protein